MELSESIGPKWPTSNSRKRRRSKKIRCLRRKLDLCQSIVIVIIKLKMIPHLLSPSVQQAYNIIILISIISINLSTKFKNEFIYILLKNFSNKGRFVLQLLSCIFL